MAANLQNPAFTNEDKAREALEAMRWPNGPVCPHCGSVEGIAKAQGKAARPGLYYCAACDDQFTVTVGTVMERSHVPISKWWMAMHLMGASKKGISAHQMHRMLGVSYKTAWFMCHRIREAMRVGGLAPLGGSGKVVESDETYIGRIKGIPKPRRGRQHKNTVLTLVERGGGARSFHIDAQAISDIMPILRENIARESRINTDEGLHYRDVGKEFAAHETVNHGEEEYSRHEQGRVISTNT